jgi:hypothetical protein
VPETVLLVVDPENVQAVLALVVPLMRTRNVVLPVPGAELIAQEKIVKVLVTGLTVSTLVSVALFPPIPTN